MKINKDLKDILGGPVTTNTNRKIFSKGTIEKKDAYYSKKNYNNLQLSNIGKSRSEANLFSQKLSPKSQNSVSQKKFLIKSSNKSQKLELGNTKNEPPSEGNTNFQKDDNSIFNHERSEKLHASKS